MVTFRAPEDASGELRHAADLVNRDLESLLEHLARHQQHQFWSNLHQYALGQIQHKGRSAHLIADDRVDAAARQALELTDERFTDHLEHLSADDCDRFWRTVHEVAEEQARETGQPIARRGGGQG
jgi:hypothetical protein